MLAGVYFLFAMFASHWVKPVDESVELYQQAVRFRAAKRRSRARGLQRRAALLAHAGARHAAGRAARRGECGALEMLHRISDAANCEFLEPRLGLIDWLRGERRYGNTLGTESSTRHQQTAVIQARGNRSFEADWFMVLTIQRYYAEDFRAAHEFAKIAERACNRSARAS